MWIYYSFPFRLVEALLGSLDDLVLERVVQVAEIIGVAGYADDELLVLIRTFLRILQGLTVDNVELNVVASKLEVSSDEAN